MGIDYEAKYNLKPLHDSLLKNMVVFDQYCRKHQIEYSLCGGTRLGAVRHGGFIPWDNDVDIEMVRKEYERLRQCMLEDVPEFKISDFLYEKKIILEGQESSYIDLFILDPAPDNKCGRWWKKSRLLFIQGMLHENPPKNKKNKGIMIFLWVTYLIGKPFQKEKLRGVYERVSRESEHCNTKQLTTYNTGYKLMCTYDAELIEAGYQDILFCGRKMRIFKSCKKMLEKQYRDYMKWPDDKDRHPAHQRHENITEKKI